MSSSTRSSNETLEVTIRQTRAASRRLLAAQRAAAQLAPATEVNIQTQVNSNDGVPPVHHSHTGRGRPRSTGSRQAPRAPSSPEVTVGPAVELATLGPSATVIAAPGVIRVPVEVDLTQDSDEEDDLLPVNPSSYSPGEPLFDVDDPDLDEGNASQSSTSTATPSSPDNQEAKGVIRCPICGDTVTEMQAKNKRVHSTLCGHIFCCLCIKKAVAEEKKCPTCGKCLNMRKIHPLYM